MFQRLTLGTLCLLLLAGCASQPSFKEGDPLNPEQVRERWLQWQDRLSRVDAWEIEGRVAVVTADDSANASLFWEQSPEDFRLRMYGPFGAGSVDVQSDENGVFMEDENGEELRAANAEGLVWMRTGWEIPVAEMRAWVLGAVPETDNPTIQVDQYGHTMAFQSGDWYVEFPDYTEVEFEGQPLALPRKIYLQSPYIKVKMAVGQWTLK